MLVGTYSVLVFLSAMLAWHGALSKAQAEKVFAALLMLKLRYS